METKLPEGFVQISEEQALEMIRTMNNYDGDILKTDFQILKDAGYIRKSKLEEAREATRSI